MNFASRVSVMVMCSLAACSGDDATGGTFISSLGSEESGDDETSSESGASQGDGDSGDGDTSGDGDGTSTGGDGDGDGDGTTAVTAETSATGDGDGDGDGTTTGGDGTAGDGDGTAGDGDGTAGDGDGTTGDGDGCAFDTDCAPCEVCNVGMCAPALIATDPKGDCGTCRDCSGTGTCRDLSCADQVHTFNIQSDQGGAFSSAAWQGGFETQVNGACTVTATFPTASIDLVGTLGDAFAVGTYTGYSFCDGTGGEDGDGCSVTSCPPVGIGSCEAGRPSCSAALNGTGSARYTVQCNGPICTCASDAECGTCRTCQGSVCVAAAAGTDPSGACGMTSCDGTGNCSI